jgi:toxin-antitoxin system PIN domain toxin
VTATVDANVLVYASDEASARHEPARVLLEELAAGPTLLYVFWPTVMAYLRIATHPSVFERPLSPDSALGNVERLLAAPAVQTAGEEPRFWPLFREVANDGDARGNLVPDAHLVSLMRQNGVRTIWTHDRDFHRFPGLDVRDPFAAE